MEEEETWSKKEKEADHPLGALAFTLSDMGAMKAFWARGEHEVTCVVDCSGYKVSNKCRRQMGGEGGKSLSKRENFYLVLWAFNSWAGNHSSPLYSPAETSRVSRNACRMNPDILDRILWALWCWLGWLKQFLCIMLSGFRQQPYLSVHCDALFLGLWQCSFLELLVVMAWTLVPGSMWWGWQHGPWLSFLVLSLVKSSWVSTAITSWGALGEGGSICY